MNQIKKLFVGLLALQLATIVNATASRSPHFSDKQKRDSATDGIYQAADNTFPAYGVPSGSFPSYEERAILVWVNMVRAAPVTYRDDWIKPWMHSNTDTTYSRVFADTTFYGPRPPLLWNLNLNRVSRAHGVDRATCPTSSVYPHNDCNNTDSTERISKFYSWGWGEVYWPPYKAFTGSVIWPWATVAGWICDGSTYSDGTLQECPIDNTKSSGNVRGDGHRQNLMDSTAYEIGCGNVFDATAGAIATCDTGYHAAPYGTPTAVGIASGAHIFIPTKGSLKSSTYRYAVNWAGSAVTSAKVFIDGDTNGVTLNLQSGTTTQGTYWSDAYTATSTEGCHTYHFVVNAIRFPANGYYSTTSVGTCTADWTTQSNGGGGAQCSTGACCVGGNFAPSTTACRTATTACDATEYCTGNTADCPADTFAPSTTVCRTATTTCDATEYCTGTSSTCPADSFAPSTTVCRTATTICDATEYCTGSSATCPTNGFAPATKVCRNASGACDLPTTCSGSSATCPSTINYRPSTYVCNNPSQPCALTSHCTGSSASCPSNPAPTTTICAAAQACSYATYCDGSSILCPGATFKSSSVVCKNSTDICHLNSHCTGSSASCPALPAGNVGSNCTDACDHSGQCDASGSCVASTECKNPNHSNSLFPGLVSLLALIATFFAWFF